MIQYLMLKAFIKSSCCETTIKLDRLVVLCVAIISATFDKCPYFGHISSRDPRLTFDLYVILLFNETFCFGRKTIYDIHLYSGYLMETFF